MSFGRGVADPVTRHEHEDIERRVGLLEGKLDRITWLLIMTLAVTCADLARSIIH